MTERGHRTRAELWIPLAYAALAGLWIATSDELVLHLAGSLAEAAELSMFKGLVFVGVTALLLYAGVRMALERERAARHELAEGEALLRAITDALPDAVSLKDTAGRWLFANPAAVAALDLPHASILGRTDLELQPDRAIAKQLMEADRRVLETGAPEIIEVHRRTRSRNHEQTWLVSKAPWRDGAGRIRGIVSTSRDITNRSAREAEILARLQLQDQLTSVAASVPGVICTWRREPDGGLALSYATAAFEGMYGLSVDEVTDDVTTFLARVDPDDARRLVDSLGESARACTPWHGRYRYHHPTRGPRLFEGWSQPVREPGGAVSWHGYVADITESEGVAAALSASEAALVEREHRLATIVETALDSFRVLDADGRIVDVNDAYCALTGYPRDELLKMHAFDLLPMEDVAAAADGLERVRAEGSLRGELRHRCKDGRIVELDVAARWLDVGGGRIVAFLRDITERKARDAQAWQSQKLESIGQLAGGIAHDFNNLLTVILSCAEVVHADVSAGVLPATEDVKDIHDAGLRATELTKQLLTFARRQESAPGSVDLNAVVRGTESMLRRLLGEDIALELELAPDLGRTRCDPSQLDQVVMNLAVNARDAMPTGGRLTLRTANVDGPAVCLCVTDTGHGMTPEVRSRIFEPFFTTKAHGEGTGLGLATVYGIVKQNDGTVDVESEPGRGTTFRVTFPREDLPAPGPDTLDALTAAPGDETVLLVEDDDHVRDVSVRSLRSAGYRVLVATRGEEAIAIAREEPGIHLVITDVVMPGMNGRGVSDALREILPGARVLFVSGHTSLAIARRGVSDDGADFLSKPFTPSTLLVRVREVLDRRVH